MTKEAFKVQDICAIIKECSKSKVREFSFGALKMSFTPAQEAQTPEPTYTPTKESIEAAKAQTKEANAEEEILYKEQQLEQMLIEDPVSYFEAVKRGDLENERA